MRPSLQGTSPLRLALSRARRGMRDAAIVYAAPTSSLRVVPDYLIVGAQRSGTTSLQRYLLQHPAVINPLLGMKGIHFFDTAFDKGWAWYRAHFPTQLYMRAVERIRGTRAVTGEASPYYMFHPLGPPRIAAHLPGVRLIVLLRNPVDRAYSHYQHMVLEGKEDLLSFEEAIEREPERLRGESERLRADHAYRSHAHQHHAYLARGLYADQLELLFRLFPRDRVLVLASTRFFADPAAGLRTVTEFLGLRPFEPRALRPHNVGSYGPMAAHTREKLISFYEEPDARLFDLLGWQPY